MTIWLTEPSSYRPPLDHWPLPPGTIVMRSEAYDQLRRDMLRYVRGQVRGRSFLIAGHRGVGKTSLSVRAVEELATEILRASVLTTDSGLPEGPVQRPLLVKLEGPSMLAERPRAACKPTSKGDSHAGEASPPADEGAGDAEREAEEKTAKRAHVALEQITIGLYRALAHEATTGYRAHALRLRGKAPYDQTERAAQLALELDLGPEPARLRNYWTGLARLPRGIFWPALADESLADRGMHDQGLREITALATAAQAFKVCAGRIHYKTTSREAAQRVQSSEVKWSGDLAQILGRLGTLGIGALTGVSILAAQNGPAAAVGGGLAVWLLGTLGLNWSEKRSRTEDRSIDYSFIRDSSLATLGRDLPLVIARIREAGLAPVFIIDELDKVTDAPLALADLVGKLKHLIADYGFFCFLVNRDCYEEIEKKIREKNYPAEHTLFSQRLLLRPDPGYMLPYLLEITGFDPEAVLVGKARAVFALVAMHDTHLNLTDLMRYLARFGRGADAPIGSVERVTAPRKLILACVQLAIDVALRSELLADRVADDPLFAQLALDTLYYPSHQWRSGHWDVDPDRETLKAYLVERMRQERSDGDGANSPAGSDGLLLSDDDLGRLHKALVDMLRLLADLPALNAALGDRNASGKPGEPEAGDVRLADIVPLDVPAICEAKGAGFRFLFTPHGERIGEGGRLLTEDDRKRIIFLIGYMREFQALLARCGTDLDQLAETPLINSSGGGAVATALATLTVSLPLGESDPEILHHLAVLESLYAEIGARADAIGWFLSIVASLRPFAPDPAVVVPAISRLIRFRVKPEHWMRGLGRADITPIPASIDSLARWGENEAVLFGSARVGGSYVELVEPLRRYFAAPKRSGILVPDPGMLIEAVEGRVPGTALAANMNRMTLRDWSALALAALPGERRDTELAPYWMLVAALRALGFGEAQLLELADPSLRESLATLGFRLSADEMTAEHGFELAREFAAKAGPHRRGVLAVVSPTQPVGDSVPTHRVPVLMVDKQAYEDYSPILGWLSELGFWDSIVIALDEDEDGETSAD